MAKLYADDVHEGTELPPLERCPDTMQLVKYAGAEEDWYQGHYDHNFAVSIGQKTVFAHGWLTFSFVVTAVTDWLGPDGTLKSARCRCLDTVYPGTELKLGGLVTKKYEENGERLFQIELHATGSDGKTYAQGTAVVALPSRN